MKQDDISYKVKYDDGDGIPFWKVVAYIGNIDMWSMGMSRSKEEMIELAEKLNKEAVGE